MKNPFLKKIMTLLEKEVCQEELCKEVFSSHLFKPIHIDKKQELHHKHSNIASKCLKTQETILSEGVTVKGELKFEKQLRINGTFEGSLETEGKIIVGPSGVVKGDISLDEAEVHGKIIGNMNVKKLIVGPTAEIFGNIRAESLDFQKGAKLIGQIDIAPESSKIEIFENDTAMQNLG